MLVLSRKTGQKIIINDNIELVVIETRGDFVRLGINAPSNVSIYREEIYEEIKQSNAQSVSNISDKDVDFAMNLMKQKADKSSIKKQFNMPLARLKKDR